MPSHTDGDSIFLFLGITLAALRRKPVATDHIRVHKPRSTIVLNELSNEAISTSTRVLDNASISTRVVDASTSSQAHPSQELRLPQRSGR